MTPPDPLLSVHRLPQPYRAALTVAWAAPAVLLAGALLLGHGASLALFDPRVLIPLGALLLPALYIWQEGIDVRASGLRRRVHLPRDYPFTALGGWRCAVEADVTVLTIWDAEGTLVVACPAAHLTDLPRLLAALRAHVQVTDSSY